MQIVGELHQFRLFQSTDPVRDVEGENIVQRIRSRVQRHQRSQLRRLHIFLEIDDTRCYLLFRYLLQLFGIGRRSVCIPRNNRRESRFRQIVFRIFPRALGYTQIVIAEIFLGDLHDILFCDGLDPRHFVQVIVPILSLRKQIHHDRRTRVDILQCGSILPFLFQFQAVEHFVTEVSVLHPVDLVPDHLLGRTIRLDQQLRHNGDRQDSRFIHTLVDGKSSHQLMLHHQFVQITRTVGIVQQVDRYIQGNLVLMVG